MSQPTHTFVNVARGSATRALPCRTRLCLEPHCLARLAIPVEVLPTHRHLHRSACGDTDCGSRCHQPGGAGDRLPCRRFDGAQNTAHIHLDLGDRCPRAGLRATEQDRHVHAALGCARHCRDSLHNRHPRRTRSGGRRNCCHRHEGHERCHEPPMSRHRMLLPRCDNRPGQVMRPARRSGAGISGPTGPAQPCGRAPRIDSPPSRSQSTRCRRPPGTAPRRWSTRRRD